MQYYAAFSQGSRHKYNVYGTILNGQNYNKTVKHNFLMCGAMHF